MFNPFLIDNEYRGYPFITPVGVLVRDDLSTFDLPDNALVDFRCQLGLDADWHADGRVYLQSIERVFSTLPSFAVDYRLKFTFYADYGLVGYKLVFIVSEKHAELATITADALLLNDDVPQPHCSDGFVWRGALTVGILADLAALLAPGEVVTTSSPEDYQVEPCLVCDRGKSYVRSINLVNRARIVAATPVRCGGTTTPPFRPLHIHDTCLIGSVALQEGYNCVIQQNDLDQSIQIGGAPALNGQTAGGAGPPCGETKIHDDEVPPDGSLLLTGGDQCKDLITGFNGLSTANLKLGNSRGVIVRPEPDAFTLHIDIDLATLNGPPQ